MKPSRAILLACQLLAASAIALPHEGEDHGLVERGQGAGAGAAAAAGGGQAAGEGAGAAAEGEAAAAEGEEGAENEVDQDGQFDTAIELGGGDVKTDTLFPPGVSEPPSQYILGSESD